MSLQSNDLYEDRLLQHHQLQDVEPTNKSKNGREDDAATHSSNSVAPDHKQQNDEDVQYPNSTQLSFIALGLFLSVFLIGLDRTIIATAIPKITTQFNSLDDVGWYGSAYLLGTCSFQLFFGKLYNVLSIKWTYMVSVLLFEIGSALCGAAPTSSALIGGRVIAGVGAAGIYSGALLILTLSMPLRKRPIFTSMLGAMGAIASMVGPPLGGALTDKVSWRWTFYINLPIGAITIFTIFITYSDPKDRDVPRAWKDKVAQFDLLGTAIFIPAVVSLLLATQWGGSTYPWNSWRIILLFCFFGVLTLIWGVVQWRKGDNAMLPLRIARQRSIAAAMWASLCSGAGYLIVTYYLPIWFQAVKDTSATRSGVDFLPTIISMTVFAISAGIFTTKIGYYVPAMLASSIIAPIGMGLFLLLKPDTSASFWIGVQILYGSGTGMGLQMPFTAAQTVLNRKDVSIGASLMLFMQLLSGALFLSIGQSVFSNTLIDQLQKRAPNLDPAIVTGAGASNVVAAVERVAPTELQPVLMAYNEAIVEVFVVATVMVSLFGIGAVFMEWKSVKGKEPTTPKPGEKERSKSVG